MATTHSEAEDILISYLLNNRPSVDGVEISKSKIMTPNQPFIPKPNETWLRATINWDESTQLESGYSGLDVTEGVFSIDIFSEQNKGNKVYKQIQTQLIALYNKKKLNGCVNVYGAQPVNIGKDESWYHYQLQFTCRITF